MERKTSSAGPMLVNKTIGIIGGGQLALMLCQSASALGIKTVILDPNENAPASKICTFFINVPFDCARGFEQLNNQADIIIYEFENINLTILENVDSNKLLQGTDFLRISQDRLLEKDFAKKNNFRVVNYSKIASYEELADAIKKIGLPGILKTTRFGYDGKGQILITEKTDIEQLKLSFEQPMIYEQKIDFDFEISVISIRNQNKEIKSYYPFLNEHKKGILFSTTHQQNHFPKELVKKAQNLIENLINSNDYYGILCIEFFVKDNQLYFNEFAPRPHNSGHITMDSCLYSQFDNFIRSAVNLPLGNTEIKSNGQMINILGQNIDSIKKFNINNGKLYLYGKDKIVNNRKMGHINFIGSFNNDSLITTFRRDLNE